MAKKAKKMTTTIEGSVITFNVINGEKGQMTFDVNELPENVVAYLLPYAAKSMMVDASGGFTEKEAEAKIIAKWESLVAGKLSIRKPPEPQVSLKTLKDNLLAMSEKERKKNLEILSRMIDVSVLDL